MVVSHLKAMTKEGCSDLFLTVPPHSGILRAKRVCRAEPSRYLNFIHFSTFKLNFVLKLKKKLNIFSWAFFILFNILFYLYFIFRKEEGENTLHFSGWPCSSFWAWMLLVKGNPRELLSSAMGLKFSPHWPSPESFLTPFSHWWGHWAETRRDIVFICGVSGQSRTGIPQG